MANPEEGGSRVITTTQIRTCLRWRRCRRRPIATSRREQYQKRNSRRYSEEFRQRRQLRSHMDPVESDPPEPTRPRHQAIQSLQKERNLRHALLRHDGEPRRSTPEPQPRQDCTHNHSGSRRHFPNSWRNSGSQLLCLRGILQLRRISQLLSSHSH